MKKTINAVRNGLLFVLSLLMWQGTFGQTYNVGETVTNSTGSYSLNLVDGAWFPHRIKEYKNGSLISDDTVTVATKSYAGKSDGAYQYDVRKILGSFYGTILDVPVGSVFVTVINILAPPGAISFAGLSHSGSNADSDGAFTVSWSAVSGTVSSYELYQRINSGGWTQVYNGAQTSITRNLNDGLYEYRARACNGSGCSAYTAIKSVNVVKTPVVPASISGPATDTDGAYALSWTSSSGTVSRYTLQRSINNGSWLTIQDTASSNRTESALSDASYRYRVRACNSLSCSGWSSAKSIQVLKTPSVPGSLTTPPNGSDGSFTFSWSASSGTVTRYELDRAANGGAWSTIQNSLALSKTETGLANAAYTYRVRACNAMSCSNYGNTLQVFVNSSSPAINIVQPVAHGVFPVGTAIGLLANASDPQDGSLNSNVSWSSNRDGNLGTGSPLNLTTLSIGVHILTATVSDSANQSSSDSVEITITALPSEPLDLSSDPLNDFPVEPVYYGQLSGTPSVGKDGSFNYHLPIGVPPGVNDLVPTLALTYNSSRKNGDLGWGWSLSGISSITRCPANQIRDNYISGINWTDAFKFCLDGQRLVEVANGEYRTEQESFSRITSIGGTTKAPDFWKVERKDGSVVLFGNGDNAKIEDGSGYTLAWYQQSLQDLVGNSITYHYEKNSSIGVHRIQEVRYGDSILNNSVFFVYEARADIIEKFVAGAKNLKNKRLKEVRTYANGVMARKYELNYQIPGHTYEGIVFDDSLSPSKLNSVQVCYGGAGESCGDAITFAWFDQKKTEYELNEGIAFQSATGFVKANYMVWDGYQEHVRLGTEIWTDYSLDMKYGKSAANYLNTPADFDGDHFPDDIVVECRPTCSGQVFLSSLGYPISIDNAVTDVLAEEVGEVRAGQWAMRKAFSARPSFIDLNGDGMSDLIYMPSGGSAGSRGTRVYLSQGSNGFVYSPEYSLAGNKISYTMILRPGSEDVRWDVGYRILLNDVNADGLVDVLRFPYAFGTLAYPAPSANIKSGQRGDASVALNTGNGFAPFVEVLNVNEFSDLALLSPWSELRKMSSLALGDINGDRLPDLVSAFGNIALGNFENGVFSFIPASNRNEYIASGQASHVSLLHSLVDVNGDNLSDIILVNSIYPEPNNPFEIEIFVSLSNGQDFEPPTSWAAFSRYCEFPGYGCLLGLGVGALIELSSSLRFADLNSDGNVDLVAPVVPHPGHGGWLPFVSFSNGVDRFDLSSPVSYFDTFKKGVSSRYEFGEHSFFENTAQYAPHLIAKVNSSNEIEINYRSLASRNVYSPGSGAISGEMLAPISEQAWPNIYASGGSESGDHVAIGWSAPLNSLASRYAVQDLDADNGVGGSRFTEYQYHDAKFHRQGHGDLGFAKIEKVEHINNNETLKSVSEFHQYVDSVNGYKLTGQPKRERSYLVNQQFASEQLLGDTKYKWEVRNYNDDIDTHNSPHFFPYLESRSSESWDLTGQPLSTSRYYTSDDELVSCNSLLESYIESVTNIDLGAANDDHYSEDGVLLRAQKVNCGGNSAQSHVSEATTVESVTSLKTAGRWVIGLPGLVKQDYWVGNSPSNFNGNGDITRTKSYTYNSLGQIITETIEPNGSADVKFVNSYTYNMYGSVSTVTESITSNTAGNFTSRTSTINESYNNGERYLLTTNPVGHTTSTIFSADFGLPRSETDVNGLETITSYDALGREKTVSNIAGVTNYSYHKCNSCFDYHDYENWYVHTKQEGASATRTYFDTLNREIGTRYKGLAGDYIYTFSEYDSLGRKSVASDPFFAVDAPVITTSTYDALNRVISVGFADNTANSISYSGLTQIHTNRENQSQTRTFNGAGWVMRVTDNAGTPIDYTYSAVGDLATTRVNSDSATDVTISYDQLGRRTSLYDPNIGLNAYTYNAFGHLVSETDGNGIRTSYRYDKLDRQIQRTDDANNSTGNRQVQNWDYDTAPRGSSGVALGELAALSGTNTDGTPYVETYTYTDAAILKSQTVSIANNNYTSSYFYDAFLRPTGFRYPSALTLQYEYNDSGYRFVVSDTSTGNPLWRADESDARGNLKELRLGSGNVITTTKFYDLINGRIQRIKAFNNADDIQDQEFNFSALGNLTRRIDNVHNINQCFGYDAMNRLSSSGFGSGCTGHEQYTYDDLGNIVTKTGVSGTYGYGAGAAGPNAVTSANGNSYSYDAAGNLTSVRNAANSLIKSVSYTTFNKPATMTANGNSSTVVYGPHKDRVKQSDSRGRETLYVGLGNYEIVTENGVSQLIHYLEDWGTYTITNGSGYYQYTLRDHIGSVVAKVGQLGEVELLSNGAWGERLDETWAGAKQDENFQPIGSARGFTDHEHLDGVGLIHMNGRVYDPELGRFLSPDPFVQAPYNTQSYNRYSYVFNNPLSFVDPTGYVVVSRGWTCEGDSMCTSIPMDGGTYDNYLAGIGLAIDASTGLVVESKTILDVNLSENTGFVEIFDCGSSGCPGGASGRAVGCGDSCHYPSTFRPPTEAENAAFEATMSTMLSFTPAGFSSDVYTLVSGKDLVSGDDVGAFWRVAGVVPFVSEAKNGVKALSPFSAAALRKGEKFFKGFEKRNGYNQSVRQLGNYTEFSIMVPGNKSGYTQWVKSVNQDGKTIRMFHDTFDNTGMFLHRSVKMPGPERHIYRDGITNLD